MLEQAADAIRHKRQVRVDVIPADLSRQAEVERVADAAGPLDILVNNAGAIPPGNLLAVDDAAWRASPAQLWKAATVRAGTGHAWPGRSSS